MKKPQFVVGEFYHIYNRGNNKRPIFLKPFDLQRFIQSMTEFNIDGPIGSIYAASFNKNSLLRGSASKLWLSSWGEYGGGNPNKNKLCNTAIVSSQFKTPKDYKKFAEEALKVIREKKEMEESLKLLLRG